MSYLVLACAGLDKPEGSVAREVALRLAEEAGADIVCPVALNRTPARYKKKLAENELVVVDGCATRCAAKLASAADAKIAEEVVVSDLLKRSGTTLPPELRLGPQSLEVARTIVDEIKTRSLNAPEKSPTRGEARAAAAFESPSGFTVVVHDKYEFRIPLTGFFFNANDVWAQVAGARARVGISDYMQQRLTDITYVDAPEVGTTVEQFGEAATVESIKATFELVSPVSGTVVALNQAVVDAPGSINEDPYGSWIVEVELTAWEEDRVLLVDGPAYAADVERKAADE